WSTPVAASIVSSAVTVVAASSTAASRSVLTTDPDRRAATLAVKLRAIVGARWGLPDGLEVEMTVIGASLADREGGRTWVLLDDDPERRLGMALALAVRGGAPGQAHDLHVITEDPGAAGVLARRAAQL